MRTLFLSLLSLLGFTLAAQPATDSAPATPPTNSDTTLLWKITDGNGGAPSYLFGTIHLIPENDYFLPATVEKAMTEATEIYFEIDPRDMQNPAKMMSLMNQIMMKGDTSLEDLLSTPQYDTLATYFETTGMPFFMLKKMKPMFLSAMVGQDLSGGNPFAEGGGMRSYEMELSQMATDGGKVIGGLETMEFQLSLFDSIPYRAQAKMLFDAVAMDMNKDSTSNNQLDQMIDMYKRQAVAEMSQMISDESADFGNFEELLVVRRNEKWVPVIIGRLATPSVYAVGAGHLGGDKGVISLLREQGMTVEPVYE